MVVVGGASTTSRNPERMLTYSNAVRSQGCKVWLDNGRIYRDWQMGLSGLIFGYMPEWQRKAIEIALYNGSISSISSRDEHIVAEMLGDFYQDIQCIRWMLNGSDPNAAAVKLARAITGRKKILCAGYHGTSSAFAKQPGRRDDYDNSLGTLSAERDAYHDLEWLDIPYNSPSLDLSDYAAIIIECPPDDIDRQASQNWLHNIANRARRHGALFVLDEVVTGFRYQRSGAAGYYHLHGKVDLYCFGKTLGNGVAIAALGGKWHIMQWLKERPGGGGRVHWSNTFNGCPIQLSSARATLRRLHDHPPWGYLYDIGEYLKSSWNALDLPYKLVGHPTRPVIDPETIDDAFTNLRRDLFEQGHIVTSHPWYVNTAMSRADVDALCGAAGEWKQ